MRLDTVQLASASAEMDDLAQFEALDSPPVRPNHARLADTMPAPDDVANGVADDVVDDVTDGVANGVADTMPAGVPSRQGGGDSSPPEHRHRRTPAGGGGSPLRPAPLQIGTRSNSAPHLRPSRGARDMNSQLLPYMDVYNPRFSSLRSSSTPPLEAASGGRGGRERGNSYADILLKHGAIKPTTGAGGAVNRIQHGGGGEGEPWHAAAPLSSWDASPRTPLQSIGGTSSVPLTPTPSAL